MTCQYQDTRQYDERMNEFRSAFSSQDKCSVLKAIVTVAIYVNCVQGNDGRICYQSHRLTDKRTPSDICYQSHRLTDTRIPSDICKGILLDRWVTACINMHSCWQMFNQDMWRRMNSRAPTAKNVVDKIMIHSSYFGLPRYNTKYEYVISTAPLTPIVTSGALTTVKFS